jgi:hypothetical protein
MTASTIGVRSELEPLADTGAGETAGAGAVGVADPPTSVAGGPVIPGGPFV